jgi:uncharacterized membrane protein
MQPQPPQEQNGWWFIFILGAVVFFAATPVIYLIGALLAFLFIPGILCLIAWIIIEHTGNNKH